MIQATRGEPIAGKIGVAQVILNRSISSSWPSTICGVVHQGEERGEKCQFSFVCQHKLLAPPHGEAWQQASWVADEVLSGGAWLRELLPATHYHRTDLEPVWRLALKEIGRIGSHVFYGPPGTTEVLALVVAGDAGLPRKAATKHVAGAVFGKSGGAPKSSRASSVPDRSVSDWAKRSVGQ